MHLKYLIENSGRTNEIFDENASALEENLLSVNSDDLLATDSRNGVFPFPWPESIEGRTKRYQSNVVNKFNEKLITLMAEPIDGW